MVVVTITICYCSIRRSRFHRGRHTSRPSSRRTFTSTSSPSSTYSSRVNVIIILGIIIQLALYVTGVGAQGLPEAGTPAGLPAEGPPPHTLLHHVHQALGQDPGLTPAGGHAPVSRQGISLRVTGPVLEAETGQLFKSVLLSISTTFNVQYSQI